MPLPSISAVANLKALFRHRATVRQHTQLSVREVEMAQDVWVMYLTSTTVPCKDFNDLTQMLVALQVPQQPLLVKVASDCFRSKQHFSFQDFISLLEQCKTIHIRWLHKIQGKSLDDDLLEAFVAVGGEEDSGGEVDLDQMKEVISEFELKVDLDRIVAEMDTDGNANIDFGEFADLLRERKTSSAAAFMHSLDLSPQQKKELAYKAELLAVLKGDSEFQVGAFPGQKTKVNKPPPESTLARKEKRDDDDLLFDLVAGLGDTTSGEIGSSPVKQLEEGEGGISMMEASAQHITVAPVVLSADEFFDQEQDQDVPTEMFWYRNGKDGVGFLGLDDPLEGLGTTATGGGGHMAGGASSMLARSRRRSLGGGRRPSTSTHSTSEQEQGGGGLLLLNGSQKMQQSTLGGGANSFVSRSAGGASPQKRTQKQQQPASSSETSSSANKYMAASFYKGSGGLRALTLQERIRPSSSSADTSTEGQQQPLGVGRLLKKKKRLNSGHRSSTPAGTSSVVRSKKKPLPPLTSAASGEPSKRRSKNKLPGLNDPINYYDGVV